MNTNIKLISLLCLSTVLGACNGSNNNDTTNSVIDSPVDKLSRGAYLDDLGILPVNNSSTQVYTLNVNNASTEDYIVEGVSVSKEDSKLIKVSKGMCGILPAGGSCSIQLTPNTSKSANLLLTVQLRSSSGEVKVLHQLIRMSSQLKGQGINFQGRLGDVVTADGNYSISIPVILDESYDDIKAGNGSLLCKSNKFVKGNTCTLTMKGKAMADNTLVAARLTGYKNGKVAKVMEETEKVRVTTKANLILSSLTELNPGEEGEISVFNSGNAPATDITTQKQENSKLTISDGNPSCSGEIAENKSCTYKVKANAEEHGVEAVRVEYKSNGNVQDTVSTSVAYYADDNIKVTISSSDKLVNTIVGAKKTYKATIKNEGRAITNFKVGIVKKAADMSWKELDCHNNFQTNDTCEVEITYNPTKDNGDTGTSQLVLQGKYKNALGHDKEYSHRQDIEYSALATASLLSITKQSVGDLLNVMANIDNKTVKYEIKNTGPSDEANFTTKLTTEPYIASNGNLTKIDGLEVSTADCTAGKEIAVGGTCEVDLTYTPTKTASFKDVYVGVDYDANDGKGNGLGGIQAKSAVFEVSATEKQVPQFNPSKEVIKSPTQLTGDGTGGNPYKFIATHKNDQLQVEYIIKNEGNAAGKFKLNVPAISAANIAYEITGCNGSQEGIELQTGAECKLTILAPTEKWLENNFGKYEDVTQGSITIPINYTMDGEPQTDELHIQFNRSSLNMSYDEKLIRTSKGYEATIVAKLENPDEAGISYPIKITPRSGYGSDNLEHATVTSCKINGPQAQENQDTCTATIVFPTDLFNVNGMFTEVEAYLEAKENSTDKYPIAKQLIFDFSSLPMVEASISKAIAETRFTGVLEDKKLNDKYHDKLIYGAKEELPFEIKVTNVTEASAQVVGEDKDSVTVDASDCNSSSITTHGNHECTIKGTYTVPNFVNNPSEVADKYQTETFSYDFTVEVNGTDVWENQYSKELSFAANDLLRVMLGAVNVNGTNFRTPNYGTSKGLYLVGDDAISQLDKNGSPLGNPFNRWMSAGCSMDAGTAHIYQLNALNNKEDSKSIYLRVSRNNAMGSFPANYIAAGTQNHSDFFIRPFLSSVNSNTTEKMYIYHTTLCSQITDVNTKAQLIKNNDDLEPGHYHATFYAMVNDGRLIKYNFDWDKQN